MNKKTVKVDNAVGKVLLHDITCIVPGEFKGPAFRKGHVIREEDIESLKRLGKENILVSDIPAEEYHEEEAGELFKQLAGHNVYTKGPSEGKVTFFSKVDGLVKIDKNIVNKINLVSNIVFSTVHSHIPVKQNDSFAGIRIVPLSLKKYLVDQALSYPKNPPLSVAPFKKKKAGLIVTGNEVASGKIKDAFGPIIRQKLEEYNSELIKYTVLKDDAELITEQILEMKNHGCEFIILTGGMSVDPDDTTKIAIRNTGVEVVNYGVPVLPGNMFMVGYLEDVPVFGVPAAAVFFKITVLDLFMPYVFSNTKITKNDLINKGYGGFCRHCKICNFPYCAFGKS